MLAIPSITDNIARYGACFLSGTMIEMIFNPPEKMAAAPTPATARPAMKTADDVATAHNTEPSSNTIKLPRNVHFVLNKAYTLPNVGCMVVCISKYADPYQPTSSSA